MKLGYGIFLGYLTLALLAAYFVLNVFIDEIKPSARQAMEDSLVDSANLLAELAVDDVREGTLASGRFSRQVAAYRLRQLDASIWGYTRTEPGFRIYMTNASGIVIYDSNQEALGQDYSQWNDVYLTLKGQYGVRSSPDSKSSESTTMHVAAPIKDAEKILGVLTIAKSNRAVEPFIQRTRTKILQAGGWLLGLSLLLGVLISFWLSISVQKLVVYAERVTRGERTVLPPLFLSEFKRLGLALQSMREKLEGKRYVEEYIVTLTHEMKSPLTAIQASSELLQEPMPEAQREKFLTSIFDQSRRLHTLIDKMLQQSGLESRQALEAPESLDLTELVERTHTNVMSHLSKKRIKLKVDLPEQAFVSGDRFLLEQTLLNLFENAIDFSPAESDLEVSIVREGSDWILRLRDHGSGLPEYAKDRIFERFYSLPRPDGGSKSTGLGLPFVRQVMELHHGEITLTNHKEGGAQARLRIPAKK